MGARANLETLPTLGAAKWNSIVFLLTQRLAQNASITLEILSVTKILYFFVTFPITT